MAQINWPSYQDIINNPSKYASLDAYAGVTGNTRNLGASSAQELYKTMQANVERQLSRAQDEVYNAMNSGAATDPNSANANSAKYWIKNANSIISQLGPAVAQPIPSFEQQISGPVVDPQGTGQSVNADGTIVTPAPSADGTTSERPVVFNGQTISPSDPNYATYVAQGAKGVTSPSGPTTSSASVSNIDQTGWTDAMKTMYSGLQDLTKSYTASGKQLNPNIKITQDTIDRFLEQAKQEVGPEYTQAFKQSNDDLARFAQQTKDNLSNNLRDISKSFGQNLENTQQNFANRGLEFSSDRDKAEQSVAEQATNQVAEATKQAENNLFDKGTSVERSIGSTNLIAPNTNVQTGFTPQLGKPGVYALSSPTGTRDLWGASGGVTGTQERNQISDTNNYQTALINQKRSDIANDLQPYGA